MLILTRRSDEAIRLGDNIIIKIVEIKGNQVRLGIDAPKELRVYREELYQRIVDENRRSAAAEPEVFEKLKEVFKKG